MSCDLKDIYSCSQCYGCPVDELGRYGQEEFGYDNFPCVTKNSEYYAENHIECIAIRLYMGTFQSDVSDEISEIKRLIEYGYVTKYNMDLAERILKDLKKLKPKKKKKKGK